MSDCIFCKISQGQFGTSFLYEDEEIVVFRDINPKAKTHLLIVPKKHIDSVMTLEESDELLMGKLVMAGKKVAADLKLDGYKLQIHVGESGGQEVFHVHVHLLSNQG
ncbi:histidine triad nucleotide-binding protein [Candidatus Peregrinibacteria bacterium]|nr:histidine triad nucleotide-binding protein [Candidatus Peregrinibacteria bacterium]